MCDAVTLSVLSLAMGGATAGMQYSAQKQQARDQAAHQKRMSELERQRQLQEQSAIRQQQQGAQETRGRELERVSREAMSVASRNITAAGEAGVAGASVEALLAEGTRQQLGYYESYYRQGQNAEVTAGRQIGASIAGSNITQENINRSIPQASVSQLLVGIGKSAVDAGGMYMSLKKK